MTKVDVRIIEISEVNIEDITQEYIKVTYKGYLVLIKLLSKLYLTLHELMHFVINSKKNKILVK